MCHLWVREVWLLRCVLDVLTTFVGRMESPNRRHHRGPTDDQRADCDDFFTLLSALALVSGFVRSWRPDSRENEKATRATGNNDVYHGKCIPISTN